MKAVLLEVTRTCESAWVPVGRSGRIRVQGINTGDMVRVMFWNGIADLVFHRNGSFPVPEDAERLKVGVRVVNDESRINIDLE